MKKTTFVCYVGEEEVIVCAKETEEQTKKEFFGADMGREILDYDRIVEKDVAVSFSPVMRKN
jgi:hypothetical protein